VESGRRPKCQRFHRHESMFDLTVNLRPGNLPATRKLQDAWRATHGGRLMRKPGGSSVIKRFIDGMKDGDRRRLFFALFGGKAIGAALLMAIVMGLPAYFGHKAFADDAPVPAYVNPINTMWVCITAFLVFFMQAGFMFLEAGFARTRETVNVLL